MSGFHSAPIAIDRLKDKLEDPASAYIGWLSFDERSTALAEALGSSIRSQVLYFSFRESRERNKKPRKRVAALVDGPQLRFEELSRERQVTSFYQFQLVLERILSSAQEVVIDLSAFPREYVCTVARWILLRRPANALTLVYNHAEDYSYNEVQEGKWLSVGAQAIRPVAGFSGSVLPGRPSVLVVLAGFDKDRVDRVAESVDPDVLILGVPVSVDPKMQWLIGRIEDYSLEMRWKHSRVETFKFDCNSIESTEVALTKIFDERKNEYNFIFAPYNNKISTLAAASAAIRLQQPQIVLAAALMYNIEAFAKPSERYSVVSIPDGEITV